MKYYIKREPASLKRETAYLLLEFNKVGAEKKSPFWEKWDDKIKEIERNYIQIMGNEEKGCDNVTQYWRENNSITADLYWFLRRNFPFPIPYVLFFPSSKEIKINYNVEYNKCKGYLADKWLKDIFSRESFYKRNKEYFTRAEVKYFFTHDCDTSFGKCYDLIDYFFSIKIEANNLNLSLEIFNCLSDCFTHQIVIEYFKFLCNNKKYINNEEIKDINKFLKSEYISIGKNIDFKNHTYHSFKRPIDERYISNMIKNRFRNSYDIDIDDDDDFDDDDHKTVQDYINFICKNVRNIRDKQEEIRDICDFLKAEYINNGRDFDFENMTWRELKRLSDEWHLEDRFASDSYSRNYLNTEWEKSSIKDFIFEKYEITWIIKEITTGRALYEEGEKMHHCVFSYADRCTQGNCIIFSVRCKFEKNDSEKRIATLEISRNRELVQARGQRNVRIDNETAEIIKIWADENQIDYGDYLDDRRQFNGYVA